MNDEKAFTLASGVLKVGLSERSENTDLYCVDEEAKDRLWLRKKKKKKKTEREKEKKIDYSWAVVMPVEMSHTDYQTDFFLFDLWFA